MAVQSESFAVPYRDPVVQAGGFLSAAWSSFMRSLYDRLWPLGVERRADLDNDKSDATDIEGLSVSARAVSQATVEYLIQRITTGGSAANYVETGIFLLAYDSVDEEWKLVTVSDDMPDDAGVTFSVTPAGQVQYESSNEAGTQEVFRMFWRMRTLAGKSAQYSSQGTR